MKVNDLKQGMLLLVAVTNMRPVSRKSDPDKLTFFPDIFAQVGFGNVLPLSYTGYYFYLGKKRILFQGDFTPKIRTKTHHEVMDPYGIVYQVHGRDFKYFEPVWREQGEDEHSNN